MNDFIVSCESFYINVPVNVAIYIPSMKLNIGSKTMKLFTESMYYIIHRMDLFLLVYGPTSMQPSLKTLTQRCRELRRRGNEAIYKEKQTLARTSMEIQTATYMETKYSTYTHILSSSCKRLSI